jgi:hypothetical protein
MAPSEGTQKSTAGTRVSGSNQRGVGINWNATAILSSAPPVRIVGSVRPYQGGFRLNNV